METGLAGWSSCKICLTMLPNIWALNNLSLDLLPQNHYTDFESTFINQLVKMVLPKTIYSFQKIEAS